MLTDLFSLVVRAPPVGPFLDSFEVISFASQSWPKLTSANPQEIPSRKKTATHVQRHGQVFAAVLWLCVAGSGCPVWLNWMKARVPTQNCHSYSNANWVMVNLSACTHNLSSSTLHTCFGVGRTSIRLYSVRLCCAQMDGIDWHISFMFTSDSQQVSNERCSRSVFVSALLSLFSVC